MNGSFEIDHEVGGIGWEVVADPEPVSLSLRAIYVLIGIAVLSAVIIIISSALMLCGVYVEGWS